MSMTLEQAIRTMKYNKEILGQPDQGHGFRADANTIACDIACDIMQREVDRQTGCEHCCAGEELGYGRDSLGRSAYLYLDGNLLTADLYSDSMAVAIRFCPMCGKPLNDGKVDGDE